MPKISQLTQELPLNTDELLVNQGGASKKALAKEVSGLQALGYQQAWQDLLANRSAGVNYTNETGKPIEIQVSAVANGVGQSDIRLTVDGVLVSRDAPNGDTADFGGNVSATIPNGSTYSVSINRMSLYSWAELT